MKVAVPCVIWVILAVSTHAEDKSAEFEAHTFAWHHGAKMPYRLLKPETVEAGKKYPLVLVLHGWGDAGPTTRSN